MGLNNYETLNMEELSSQLLHSEQWAIVPQYLRGNNPLYQNTSLNIISAILYFHYRKVFKMKKL